MHYFFEDFIGLAAATPLAVLLILMPGFGLVRLLAPLGFMSDSAWSRACFGLLLGPVLLPAVDALLLRWIGFPAAIFLHLALAIIGAPFAFDTVRRVPARWLAAVGFCWILAAWANVDFDWNERLYQPVTINDGVKHAAVIGALVRSGVPLHDPFFARPGIAGYYYYFYIGPALIHWIGRPLIDSRMAFASGTFTTFLAFVAVIVALGDEAALIPKGAHRRFVRMALLLCCLSGFDLLPGLWFLFQTGHAFAQLDWWSEEVRWALTSVLWVPHHITAVIAVFTGSLIVTVRGPSLLLRAAIGGLAFATAFGCSSWVAIAAVPILALWWIYERIATGRGGMWALPLSGLTASVLSLPQIADIRAGRSLDRPPLQFYMRPVGPIRVLPHGLSQWIVHLAVTPGGYLIEFGIFALGAIFFLSGSRPEATRKTPMGRMLLVSAPVSIVMATFVRSAVIYNDFGWRSIWFAQLPALLWTASVLTGRPELLRRSPLWSAAFVLGLAAVAWDIVGMRLLRPYFYTDYVNANPQLDYELRGAYSWADRTLPGDLIVQHNPVVAYRALDFGLYSDRPVGVADVEAQLFGADYNAVVSRIADVAPIFAIAMPPSEVAHRAASAGVAAVLLTSADPLWRSAGGPPRSWICEYRSAHSCVMIVDRFPASTAKQSQDALNPHSTEP